MCKPEFMAKFLLLGSIVRGYLAIKFACASNIASRKAVIHVFIRVIKAAE